MTDEDFPLIHINTNARHLGKLKRGHRVRLTSGDHALALHPDNHKRATNAFLKGRGFHHNLTPEEIAHNHGRGIFDMIGNVLKGIIPFGKRLFGEVAPKLVPIGKDLATKGIKALKEKAPEIVGKLGEQIATKIDPQYADLGKQFGSQLGGLAGDKVTNFAQDKVDKFNPYKQINDMTGENNGKLMRANMGKHFAELDLAEMEKIIAQKRNQIQQLDGSGLYGGTPRGRGLGCGLGAGLYGGNINYKTKMPRGQHTHREKGSVGLMGNLLGFNPPALASQPYSSNFQFRSTLPPAFQNK